MSSRSGILIADGNAARRAWLRAALGDELGEAAGKATTVDEALAALAATPPRILVVGELTDGGPDMLLRRAAAAGLLPSSSYLLAIFELASGPGPTVDAGVPIFYRLTTQLDAARVRELMAEATRDRRKRDAPGDPAMGRRVLDRVGQLAAEHDPQAAARLASDALRGLLPATRARVLYVDADDGTLWDGQATGDAAVSHPVATGLAGYVARTGRPLTVDDAAADARFDRAVDDPEHAAGDRLLLHPVTSRDGVTHAVLVAIRGARMVPFDDRSRALVAQLADGWAPFLHQLALEAERASAEQGDDDSRDVFRQEAVQQLLRGRARGDVVRVHPGWLQSAYWIVIASAVAGLIFAATARVHRYSSGTAVVRFDDRVEVVTDDDGTISTLAVRPGQALRAGDLIARVDDPARARELREVESAVERALVAYLLTPADPAARGALANAILQRDSARRADDARALRAPIDGVVRELLVRQGQRVQAGRSVATMAPTAALDGPTVVAFLPAADRPQLAVGQPLRFTLPGFRDAEFDGTIQAVSADVLAGDAAVAQYLGERFVGSVPLAPQVVVVKAQLPHAAFTFAESRFELHDGMSGLAEVQLDSEPLLKSLLPGKP